MTLSYRHALLRAFPQNYAGLYAPHGVEIDLALAARQHAAYAAALRAGGLAVSVMPPDEAFPDSVFIEDTAVVWGGEALITRPALSPRTGEENGTAVVMSRTHRLTHLPDNVFAEGGDVMTTDRATYVGLSARTKEAGANEVRRFLARFGRKTFFVPVESCLHLKTAVTYLGDNMLLIAPDMIDPKLFPGFGFVEVEAGEMKAANCIRLPQHLLILDGYPKTAATLEAFARRAGIGVTRLNMSEFEKGDGSLTCLSLLWG